MGAREKGKQRHSARSGHLKPSNTSHDVTLAWLYNIGVQLRREEDPWLARPPCRSDPAITSHSTILPVAKKEKNFSLLLKHMVIDLDLSVVYILSHKK